MKNYLQQIKQNEQGLTLIELLGIAVISAIIGAIAFVSIRNVIENTRQDTHIANALQVLEAVKLAEAGGTKLEWENGTGVYASAAATGNTFDTLSRITDPWDAKNKSYLIIVEKEENEYTVTAKDSQCDFTDKAEEELLQYGRDLCDN